jgi:hypothetical protein
MMVVDLHHVRQMEQMALPVSIHSCLSLAAIPPTSQQIAPVVQALQDAAAQYQATADDDAHTSSLEHRELLAPYCREQALLFNAAADIVQGLAPAKQLTPSRL